MNTLPKNYAWLNKLAGPKLLLEFLKVFGIKETPGARSNPEILKMAKYCGLDKVYRNDGIAWCGLLIAYIVQKTGRDSVIDPLWALNWRYWGVEVARGDERLGDIYIKERRDTRGRLVGGHVALIIAEDKSHLHIGGGNQSDAVNIMRVDKNIRYWCRRPIYINPPKQAQKYVISPAGIILGKQL